MCIGEAIIVGRIVYQGYRSYKAYQTAIKAADAISSANAKAQSSNCPDNNSDPCSELEKKVRDAKDHMSATYSKGTAVCRAGMSRFELSQRASDWLNLAQARAHRDQKCFGGGDQNHQTEQANAWNQVSLCQGLMR